VTVLGEETARSGVCSGRFLLVVQRDGRYATRLGRRNARAGSGERRGCPQDRERTNASASRHHDWSFLDESPEAGHVTPGRQCITWLRVPNRSECYRCEWLDGMTPAHWSPCA
jgi:hypothetical protein